MAQAYVTLVLSHNYVAGALVLAHSLKRTKTTRKIISLVGPSVDEARRFQLLEVFDELVDVQVLDSQDVLRLELLQRPELGITLTKIHVWKLTQFSKCVFLDADTLVLKNIDDLFGRPAFAAAPDIGWPDCFNSGVFVFCPSDSIYNDLLKLAREKGSFDGGDQGLLNQYFSDWKTMSADHRLPFTDNMTANAAYGYAPAFERFRDDIRVVHFIGGSKPWLGVAPSGSYGLEDLHALWWKHHDEYMEVKTESTPYRVHSGTHGAAYHSSPHDRRVHPTPHSFLLSRSADEIVSRIQQLSAVEETGAPSDRSPEESTLTSYGLDVGSKPETADTEDDSAKK